MKTTWAELRGAARLLAPASILVYASAAAANPCKVDDLMPAYFAFAAAGAAGETPEQKADRFVRDYALAHPEFYVPEDFGDAAKLRKAAVRFFDPQTRIPVPGARPLTDERLRETTRALERALRQTARSYATVFPDFACRATVTVGISLSRFSANAFTDNEGRDFVRFGADMLARLRRPSELALDVANLYFQVYFSQLFPEVRADDFDVTWQAMWVSGIGAYVALRLNPGANERDAIGGADDLARQLGAPGMPAKAARAMLADFDRGGPETFMKWFAFGKGPEGFPPRTGQWLSLKMAEDVGRIRPLYRLVHIAPAEQRKLVHAFLEKTAKSD